MIASALATLGLLGLASASPVERKVVPNYPPKDTSKGFRLVVNVTDPSKDFSPPIQNNYVAGIHTGAGFALAGIVDTTKDSLVFYQNATIEAARPQDLTTLTDEGEPLSPYGIQLTPDPDNSYLTPVSVNAGLGTEGIGLSSFPEPYVYLLQDSYVACNTSLAYYGGEYFITIKSSTGPSVPAHCTPVRLVPECAKLETLPKGSYSSHKYALNSECYDDVSSLDWCKYGP